jgi:hypothetical protein
MTLRTVTLLGLGALALSACAQPAPRPPQPVGVAASVAPADRLVAAIEVEGCVLTNANIGAVLLRSSLTQAELPLLISQLASQGRIEASDSSSIRVLSDNCI